MYDRMVDLLRRRPDQFEATYALSNLPEDTKIKAIAPFVNFMIREGVHEKRMKMVNALLNLGQVNLTRIKSIKINWIKLDK